MTVDCCLEARLRSWVTLNEVGNRQTKSRLAVEAVWVPGMQVWSAVVLRGAEQVNGIEGKYHNELLKLPLENIIWLHFSKKEERHRRRERTHATCKATKNNFRLQVSGFRGEYGSLPAYTSPGRWIRYEPRSHTNNDELLWWEKVTDWITDWITDWMTDEETDWLHRRWRSGSVLLLIFNTTALWLR